jgi:predicted transcriptional regulator
MFEGRKSVAPSASLRSFGGRRYAFPPFAVSGFRAVRDDMEQTMKAIIELGRKGSILAIAQEQIASGADADYRLSFESARTLFSELTPARIDLLDTLRRAGSCSVYALAKAAERNYSNVHGDVTRLIERADDETVLVPFEEIDNRFPLALAA